MEPLQADKQDLSLIPLEAFLFFPSGRSSNTDYIKPLTPKIAR